MKLPVSWLKKYINFDIDVKDLAEKLTNSGSHVESIDMVNPIVSNCVTGRIVSLTKHPNADKLKCLKVDIGGDTVDLITGAGNVFEGAIIGLAMNGAVLHEDIVISPTDFRGVMSNGMLLSYKELGFSDNTIPKEYKDGVIIFPEDTELGLDIANLLNLKSPVIEFEITPNRPDCLSIEGMARETAAAYGEKMNSCECRLQELGEDISGLLNGVRIDTNRCNRYYTRIATEIEVGESPIWMQNELMLAGIRPINNIVDITNYVMLELGNPLHAFDFDSLKSKEIVVKDAEEGTKFVTLDEIERTLSASDCVITDGSAVLAIGGIMGGADSEVKNDTEKILIEGASFVSSSIRKSSKRLSLRTESSSRFEKGIDPSLAQRAVDRVCYFIETLNVGKVAKNAIDVYHNPQVESVITLELAKVNELLGTDLSDAQIINYLELLDLSVEVRDKYAIVTVPGFRSDLTRPVDLIEEVGRLYGFHNIERKMLRVDVTKGEKPYYRKLGSVVKNILTGLGYNEVMTYSFTSKKSFDKLMLESDDLKRNFVKIMNPLGEDFSVMRTTLQSSMLEVLSRNYVRKEKGVYIYEIGNTFAPPKAGDILPAEYKLLDVAFYGDGDFYYLKETLNIVLNRLGLLEVSYEPMVDNPTFHPGRSARVYFKGELLGVMGCIHPNVVKKYDIKSDVYLAELDFDKIVELANLDIKYNPLPKYPSSSRDLAVVMDESIPAGAIRQIVKEKAGKLLEEFEVFDIYRGEQIGKNKKSVAFAMKFRSEDHTLVEEEINEIMTNVLSDLKEKLGANIRE